MAISITCECGRYFEPPEAIAGSRFRCPDCGRELVVPKPGSAGEELFDSWETPGPHTSRKAIASLVLGCLFFFVCFSGMPAIHLGMDALRDIKASKQRLRGRRMAIAGIVLGLFGCLLTAAFFMPAVRSAREAARRAQCTNNLKQIALALHMYHEANGSLPPAAITDKNGRPLLSWRVAILPFIEASDLSMKFHLDEPWDSPHNLALVERMPSVYNCPSDGTLKPGTTGYLAVVGASTVFRPDGKPVRFQDITDGAERTILVGESTHSVPWTKPEDRSFDTNLPLFGLGSRHGYHNNGFNVVFADGSAQFLKSSIDPLLLRTMLLRDDIQPVGPDSF